MIDLNIDGVHWSPSARPVIARLHDRRDGAVYPKTAWGSIDGHPMFPGGSWLDGDAVRRGQYSVDGISVRSVELPAHEVVIEDGQGTRTLVSRTGYVQGALLKWHKLRCVYVVLYNVDGRYHTREVAGPPDRTEAHAPDAVHA